MTKTAMVTGATARIGAAFGSILAAEGYDWFSSRRTPEAGSAGIFRHE